MLTIDEDELFAMSNHILPNCESAEVKMKSSIKTDTQFTSASSWAGTMKKDFDVMMPGDIKPKSEKNGPSSASPVSGGWTRAAR